MLAGQLMDMRAMLHKHGVIFAYSGYVTEPVLSGVGEALKQKLTIDDADTKTLRSVFRRFRRADAEHHPLLGREGTIEPAL